MNKISKLNCGNRNATLFVISALPIAATYSPLARSLTKIISWVIFFPKQFVEYLGSGHPVIELVKPVSEWIPKRSIWRWVRLSNELDLGKKYLLSILGHVLRVMWWIILAPNWKSNVVIVYWWSKNQTDKFPSNNTHLICCNCLCNGRDLFFW